MADVPATRPSLLVRLRDAGDSDAWADFVRLYAPAVYGYARRKGLQDADAADLTQDVLRGVAGSIGKLEYDARHGLFRGWLFTLAHRRLCDFFDRRQRREQPGGDSATHALLAEHPDGADEQRWNQDVEREAFAWAAERVRPTVSETTWQAFWQTAVEGRRAKDVAAVLGLSIAAVYLAKGRVMLRLKEQVASLTGDESVGHSLRE
jgi:RNA polymerase sigma-70 factor (ECF subfamily)